MCGQVIERSLPLQHPVNVRWRSHGDEYEDESFLGYSVSNISVLMMEAVCTSEMSVYFDETTRSYILE
jgi:hypothetical protein